MEQSEKSAETLHLDLVLLRRKMKRLKNEKADLELLIETNLEHSDFIEQDLSVKLDETKSMLTTEIEKLRIEVDELKCENADLEMIIEMNSEHSDTMEEDLLQQVESTLRESEKRFRLISETIPVPITVSRVSDNGIIYANEPAGMLFALDAGSLENRKITSFFGKEGRQTLSATLKEKGSIDNFEIEGRRADGEMFWAVLYVQPLTFNDESCLLSAFYDMTERKEAEREIERLSKELEDRKKEKEGKYLTFKIGDGEFGVNISKIKRIIGIMTVTPIPNAPDHILGVMTVGGRILPVVDLRRRFEMEPVDSDEKTSVIVVEIGKKEDDPEISACEIGLVVDSVSEILNIKGNQVVDAPEFGLGLDVEYIYGMAKVNGGIKILIDFDNLLGEQDLDNLEYA